MGRYIDTSDFYANYEREKQAGRSGDEAVSNAMVATKAANVREVVRGEWKEERFDAELPSLRRMFYCSACQDWNTYGKSKFCQNCGADMRQADDE